MPAKQLKESSVGALWRERSPLTGRIRESFVREVALKPGLEEEIEFQDRSCLTMAFRPLEDFAPACIGNLICSDASQLPSAMMDHAEQLILLYHVKVSVAGIPADVLLP